MRNQAPSTACVLLLMLLGAAGCTDPADTPRGADDGGGSDVAVSRADAAVIDAASSPQTDGNPDTGSTPNPDTGSTPNADTGGTPNPDTGGTPNPDTGGTPDAGAVADASAATVYVDRTYETEVASDVWADNVGTVTYAPGAGFGGSNTWEITLFPNQPAGSEDHVCFIGTAPIAQGETNTLFVGHLLYVSGGMVDKFVANGVSGKMIDLNMHGGDGDTRQVVIWRYIQTPDLPYADTGVTGVVPSLHKGGAGGNFRRQLGSTQFDLRDYRDQWIWLEMEFNADTRTTSLWIKTQDGVFGGQRDAPLMRREADNTADWQHQYWTETPYVYTQGGWDAPWCIWGFWDELPGVPFTTNDFVRLDNLKVSTGWIAPPF